MHCKNSAYVSRICINQLKAHRYVLLVLIAACSALTGCAVVAVADAGVSIVATGVSTAVSVTGDVVKGVAKAVTP
jgi:hypothetical protein